MFTLDSLLFVLIVCQLILLSVLFLKVGVLQHDIANRPITINVHVDYMLDNTVNLFSHISGLFLTHIHVFDVFYDTHVHVEQ